MSSKESWGDSSEGLSQSDDQFFQLEPRAGALPKELRCRTPDENERGIAQTSPSVRCRTLGLRLTMGIPHRLLTLRSGSERLVCGGSGFECSVLVENTRPKTAQRHAPVGPTIVLDKSGQKRSRSGWLALTGQSKATAANSRQSASATFSSPDRQRNLKGLARISKLRAALETVMSQMYH